MKIKISAFCVVLMLLLSIQLAPVSATGLLSRTTPPQVVSSHDSHISNLISQSGISLANFQPSKSRNSSAPLLLSAPPSYAWHTFLGSASQDNTYGMAVDNLGNVYLTGESRNTWNGPTGQLPKNAFSGTSGYSEIVVVKLNSSGIYQWHTFLGSDTSYGYSISLDANGNIYVCGYSLLTWNGPGNIGPLHPFSFGHDIVVLKLNSAGEYRWHTFYGSNAYDDAYGIAVDPSGNVFIGGNSQATWNGPADKAPLHAFTGTNSHDLFILKLDSAGSYLWHTFYGSISEDYGSAVAVDSGGNVYLTGNSQAAWTGSNNETPRNAYTGYYDLFVLSLSGNGSYRWHTFYGSSAYDAGNGIAIDGSGNIFVTGNSKGTWNGPGNIAPLNPIPPGGSSEIVVIKLNTTGAYKWHTFYGQGYENIGKSIAVDAGGNVFVGGYSYAAWTGPTGQPPLHTYTGYYDLVMLELDTNGAYQWHTFYGSSSYDFGNTIAVDSSGGVYLGGQSAATWNSGLSQFPLYPYSGSYDMVVVKLGLTPGTYSISGTVKDINSQPIPGVYISDGTHSTYTDVDGTYTFTFLQPGAYTLTPERSGYTFNPTTLQVNIINSNVSNQNFTGSPTDYTISGFVKDSSGNPISGVEFSNGYEVWSITNINGEYVYAGLSSHSYTITPYKDGYTFSPTNRSVIVPPNQINQDFVGTPNQTTYAISGFVKDNSGSPISGVTIPVTTGYPPQIIGSAVTDNNGLYSINNLVPGTYTLTPYKPGYLFDPPSPNIAVSIQTSQDFTGTQADKKPWLLIYYLDGDNSVSEQATNLMTNLQNFKNNPSFNIAVMYDGMTFGDSKYYLIADKITPIERGELSSSNTSTLTDFIHWAKNTYPSDHTALILYDHGSLTRTLQDNNDVPEINDRVFPSSMSVMDLGTTLDTLAFQEGKFDVVYLATCLMGTLEDAYQLRNVTDYIVSSENGWWSNSFVGYLDKIAGSTTPEQLAFNIAANYQEGMIGNNDQHLTAPYTISVARLSTLPILVDKVSFLASLLHANMSTLASTLQNSVLNQVQRFNTAPGRCDLGPENESFDLYDFARLVKQNISNYAIQNAAQDVMNVVFDDPNPSNQYIIYSSSNKAKVPSLDEGCNGAVWDLRNSRGVAIYFGNSKTRRSFYNGDNLDFAIGTDWTLTTSAPTLRGLSSTENVIAWGPMLVAYVNTVNPSAPDDPSLPPIVSPLVFPLEMYLPLVGNNK